MPCFFAGYAKRREIPQSAKTKPHVAYGAKSLKGAHAVFIRFRNQNAPRYEASFSFCLTQIKRSIAALRWPECVNDGREKTPTDRAIEFHSSITSRSDTRACYDRGAKISAVSVNGSGRRIIPLSRKSAKGMDDSAIARSILLLRKQTAPIARKERQAPHPQPDKVKNTPGDDQPPPCARNIDEHKRKAAEATDLLQAFNCSVFSFIFKRIFAFPCKQDIWNQRQRHKKQTPAVKP